MMQTGQRFKNNQPVKNQSDYGNNILNQPN